MKVEVLLFAGAQELAGSSRLEMEINPGATAGQLLLDLVQRYPGLSKIQDSLKLAVNEEYARPDQVLKGGDELAIFPPVGGG